MLSDFLLKKVWKMGTRTSEVTEGVFFYLPRVCSLLSVFICSFLPFIFNVDSFAEYFSSFFQSNPNIPIPPIYHTVSRPVIWETNSKCVGNWLRPRFVDPVNCMKFILTIEPCINETKFSWANVNGAGGECMLCCSDKFKSHEFANTYTVGNFSEPINRKVKYNRTRWHFDDQWSFSSPLPPLHFSKHFYNRVIFFLGDSCHREILKALILELDEFESYDEIVKFQPKLRQTGGGEYEIAYHSDLPNGGDCNFRSRKPGIVGVDLEKCGRPQNYTRYMASFDSWFVYQFKTYVWTEIMDSLTQMNFKKVFKDSGKNKCTLILNVGRWGAVTDDMVKGMPNASTQASDFISFWNRFDLCEERIILRTVADDFIPFSKFDGEVINLRPIYNCDALPKNLQNFIGHCYAHAGTANAIRYIFEGSRKKLNASGVRKYPNARCGREG